MKTSLADCSVQRTPLFRTTALLICGLLGACSSGPDAPARGVNPMSDEAYVSSVMASIRFPYADMASAIDAKLAKNTAGSASFAGCDAVQPTRCANVSGNISLQRTQDITIAKSAEKDSFSVTVPVQVKGGLTTSSSAAPASFDFGAAIKLTVAANITADWCPVLGMNSTVSWQQEPRVAVQPDLNVVLSPGQFAVFQEVTALITGAVQDRINCDQIRANAQNIWAKRSVEVQLPELGAMHLRVAPENMTLNEFIVNDEALDFSFAMRGKLDLTKTAQPKETRALPALERQTVASAETLAVKLPVLIDYATISEAVSAELKDKRTVSVDIEIGTADIELKDVSSYPSFDDVVIEVRFHANMPGALPNTNGSLYISATPRLSADGKVMRLENVRTVTSLSKDIYSSLNLGLSRSVKKRIEKKLTFDVTKQITKIRDSISAELERQQDGLAIQAKVDDLSMGLIKTSPREAGLLVVSQFRAAQPKT
ncbi:MAG: hypothetical protein RL341_1138 [Pseudomonadota bacterium]